jgi:hypothetical protein
MPRIVAAVLLAVVCAPRLAAAQSFELDGHYALAKWSEFDDADHGVGARFTWKPSSMVGVDAGLTWYPSKFPRGAVPFSGRRVEGLFGATVGPKVNRIRPFAKAAAGFLQVGETPIAFACIAIFPPPLACTLAGGGTLPAFELGGGVQVDVAPRTFVRVDATDRVIKYPGPAFDSSFNVREDGFFGHALRLALGAGWRF